MASACWPGIGTIIVGLFACLTKRKMCALRSVVLLDVPASLCEELAVCTGPRSTNYYARLCLYSEWLSKVYAICSSILRGGDI